MRILVLSTLFPNAVMPQHGVFVENRLRAYRELYDADIKIIAPVPWFPSENSIFGHYARFAKVPERENRNGFEVIHPRYFLAPKISMSYAPIALERAFKKAADQLLQDNWDFDLIDAHYYYPDGVAAVNFAKAYGKPVTVTARGTDINLIPNHKLQKKMIVEAANKADHSITVAEALRTEMISLGVVPEKISTLRNGVDLDIFSPIEERSDLRKQMGLDGTIIVSVGHLIERKGHDRVIKAMTNTPNSTLLVIGEGPEKASLMELVEKTGNGDKIRFTGALPHEELKTYYNLADILVLATSREGWPNVLLEAMACGTACIATDVWGCGEVIKSPAAGRLIADRTPEAIEQAIKDLQNNPPSRNETRAYAEQFSWKNTAEKMQQIFTAVVNRHKLSTRPICSPVFKADSEQPTKPRLIVTVDTEESFDWSRFDHDAYEVYDTDAIEKFQSLSAGHGVKPLYFMTQPLIEDTSVSSYYKNLLANKTAHLGIHLHQWVTKPLTSNSDINYQSLYYSFQNNLDEDLHREKMQSLIASFENAFDQAPTLHRAGRYGIAPENYKMLEELGITHDFSPCAGFDFSHEGGPDFSRLSNMPFQIATDPKSSDDFVTVLPVSGVKFLRHSNKIVRPNTMTGFSPSYKSSPPLSLPTNAMRLSPEGINLNYLKTIAQNLIRQKVPVLTFTLHSTTLTAGGNNYCASDECVDQFLGTCNEFFTYFKEELGGEFICADELKSFLSRSAF